MITRGTVFCGIFFLLASYAYSQNTSLSDTSSNALAISPADTSMQNKQLQNFREAFNKLVEGEKKGATKASAASKDPELNVGGFVLDETRSKLGRDFYSLFYQKWQAPEGAGNFSITINEKPAPGLGTQITIKIDYQIVYAARLQPRYEYIEAVSEQAIRRCRKHLQQQASVKNQLSGY